MPAFKVNLKYATLTEVTDGLFVCGVSELKPDILWKLGITCIINCTSEVPNFAPSALYDFERVKLWLDDLDSVDISEHLDDVADKISEVKATGGKTLVHCLAGVSRSAAFAMAFLVKHQNLSLRRAYAISALKRPMVRPNVGFWRQLIEFERRLRGTSSVRLVRVECTDGGPSQLVPDVYVDAALLFAGGGGGTRKIFAKRPMKLSDTVMTSSDGESDLGSSPPIENHMTSSDGDSDLGTSPPIENGEVTSSSDEYEPSDVGPMTSCGTITDDSSNGSSDALLFGSLPNGSTCSDAGIAEISADVARILSLKGSDDDDPTCGSKLIRGSSGRRFMPCLESFPESPDLDECMVGV